MPALTPPLHYLALGDSYTIGEAVAPEHRWPVELVQRLRRLHVAIDEPQVIAVTGWTTDELAQAMGAATLTPSYDLVTLQIGVNNQYRGRSADNYRLEFAGLLQSAIHLAGDRPSRVVVVSIPDWGVTRFAAEQARDREQIARELDTYNRLARAECHQVGAGFVDITLISRHHPELTADDGLHPSAEQYALWVDVIEPIVRSVLGTSS